MLLEPAQIKFSSLSKKNAPKVPAPNSSIDCIEELGKAKVMLVPVLL